MKYVELLKQKKAYVIGAIVLLAGGLLIAMKLFTQPVDNEQVFKDVSNSSSSGQSTVKNARATSKKEQKNTRITVDIFGAVAHEGVYQIAAGARLNDLIKLAGGIDVKADLKAINRALILTDEAKIYVPYHGENAPAVGISENTTGDAGAGKGTAAAAKIDINQATVSELQELNGIGEKKAEQIVTYREENGPFKDAKELTNVSGIGDKTFEGLADQVTV